MSISDVLNRVTTIEQQLQQLQSGSMLDSTLGASSGSTAATGGSASNAGASTGVNFATALAQAQGAGSSAGGSAAQANSVAGAGAGAGASSSSTAALLAALLDGGTTPAAASGASAGVGTAAALPTGAYTQLTSDQQQFASTLAADTGLSPSVVSAWLLAEESSGAAQSRQAQGNNDWLNIGYTDSATYGASDSVWSDPVTAAQATAQWLQGQNSIPGYGTASAGVQSILSSVGHSPAAQIQAIQGSGWSSSGYPGLPSLYSQVLGG